MHTGVAIPHLNGVATALFQAVARGNGNITVRNVLIFKIQRRPNPTYMQGH